MKFSFYDHSCSIESLTLTKKLMLDRLAELIHDYQKKVREAVSLFQKYKGLANPVDWRQAGLSREGFLDPSQTIRYHFHGVGCCVEMSTGDIDWDFGHEGRHDGFDAWRLWRFAQDGTHDFPEFKDKQALDVTFAEAIVQGIIHAQHKDFHDDLYYLKSSV